MTICTQKRENILSNIVGQGLAPAEIQLSKHGKMFQTSFFDHAIRNEQDYREVWQYIENNPLKYKKQPIDSKQSLSAVFIFLTCGS